MVCGAGQPVSVYLGKRGYIACFKNVTFSVSFLKFQFEFIQHEESRERREGTDQKQEV